VRRQGRLARPVCCTASGSGVSQVIRKLIGRRDGLESLPASGGADPKDSGLSCGEATRAGRPGGENNRLAWSDPDPDPDPTFCRQAQEDYSDRIYRINGLGKVMPGAEVDGIRV
jgi:hypothetical protein